MKLNVKDVLRIRSHTRPNRLRRGATISQGIGYKYESIVSIADLIGVDYLADVAIEIVDPSESNPIPMLLTCPMPNCGARHIDEGVFATKSHHTHSCQICGHTWRPTVVPTVGVQFLPGFKSEV